MVRPIFALRVYGGQARWRTCALVLERRLSPQQAGMPAPQGLSAELSGASILLAACNLPFEGAIASPLDEPAQRNQIEITEALLH